MLTTLVLLALSKVFDSISYPILLHKLNSVDNSPETTKWFENYVTLGQSSIGFTQALPVTITQRTTGSNFVTFAFCIYKVYH